MRKQRLFRSKNEQVYDYLCSHIMTGEIQPGSALVIDTLAQELGVSQIPIREAMRQLEADGFVIIEPYVGARVTKIHAGSIREIFGLLEAAEIISGRIACQTMSDSDLHEVEAIINGMASLIDQPDEWTVHNKRLHEFICEKAQTPLVAATLTKALAHWDRLRLFYLDDVFAHRVKFAQAEHEQLLVALRDRDEDRLEEIVHEHNRIALQAYITHLEHIGALPQTDS